MIKKFKKNIKRLFVDYLNNRGYYKISQLRVGGNCGLCGEHLPTDIFAKDYSWGMCNRCAK